MKFFYYRLNPPRPSFAQDMNDEEKALMATHAAFWWKLVADRTAIVFGPVFAGEDVFGVAIVRGESLEAATELVRKDPALLAHQGFTFELHPMMATVAENC